MGTETDLQQAARKALYYAAPAVRLVPVINEGRRSRWEQMQAKKLGLAKGFPDCMAIWPGAGVAFLEFKLPKGVVRVDQEEWHRRLEEYGHKIAVVRSIDDVFAFLSWCGAPVTGRVAA